MYLIDKLVFILYDDSKCRIYLKDNVMGTAQLRLRLALIPGLMNNHIAHPVLVLFNSASY